MGLCCSVSDNIKIELEFTKKNTEQVLMIVGVSQSGKSTLIKQFMNVYGHGYMNENTIKCQYPLKSWVINEYTDQSMMKYSANSYQYFDLVNKYPKKKGYDKHNINEHMKHSIDHLGASKHFDLLFCGYFRSIHSIINIPLDIITSIAIFYAEYQLDSFKIRCSMKLDLWKMDMVYYQHFHTLFDFINGLIFMCDISKYDESYSCATNKFVNDLSLFSCLVNNNTLSKDIKPIVLCNKMDLFQYKFNEKHIPLNKCSQFVNTPNDLVLKDAKELIRQSFQNLTKRNVYVRFVTAIDSDVKDVINDITNQKITNSMQKIGLIPHHFI